MNRKIISAFLILALCCSLVLTVSAEPKAIDFVTDEFGVLAAEELTSLNEQAYEIYTETDVGIFFVFTQSATLADYDIDLILNGIEDYVIMLENENNWITFYGGKGTGIDLATEEYLRGVYDGTETYVDGIAAFLQAAGEQFPRIADTPQGDILNAEPLFVYDEADLLTDSEESSLREKLANLSSTYHAEIVIYTVGTTNGVDVDTYLNDTYDNLGFGYGADRDGVMLLLCMDTRDYRILSNGYAGVAIDTGIIETIGDAFVSDLSDGNYSGAFSEFADQCGYYLDGYLNGFPFNSGMSMAVSLIIGAIAAFAVGAYLKGQLKSVYRQNQANSYVKYGSMKLTQKNDFFLYREVTRTEKTSESSGSSSNSGSRTARSTGGGKF